MKFTISLAAVAALLPAALAHVSMDFPKPFQGGADNVEPLQPSGSNFPCMAPNYDLESQLTIAPGESGQIVLSRNGGAPHGGGSCQISLTYDMAPTAGSRFTVIKSFQGACPVRAEGNEIQGPYTLPYTIPADAPSGKAVLAWSWFNKVGNREMYMRCSPITISGSNSDVSTFSKRPEILKANIGNGCITPAGKDINFPAPGDDVVGQGNASPEGNCGASGSAPIVVQPQPERPAAPSPILAPGNGNGGPVVKLPVAPKPSNPVESPVESPVEAPAPVETETPIQAPVETPVEEAPVRDEEPVVAKPISPPAVVAPETPVTAPTTPPTPDAIPCDEPGAIVCLGKNNFALCNHGFLVNMGKTAMGTECNAGTISARAYPIRLTGHHRRRHGKF
ncbi:hypothetical protein BJ508DRAFT_410791 [Ascobolus immersus RN42]|uniref:Lytic polysaccharide monooxygenase n=1 Tax=Ascobolus immersus RN42 TaxID=1160509 RepID=A0A3N4IMC9_ASCIM|nr:hypothetical protein BJ508DRAFT_410791 [Ascobolus immersus RN42]